MAVQPESLRVPVVADLRCEYTTGPISVDATAPRLSWVAQFSGQNWKQVAYQILVASTPEGLAKNQADLWDSGKVKSRDSIQIVYAGKALASRQACYWKVKVWDEAGAESSWSKPQVWEMGLLTEADWSTSRWIGVQPNSKKQEPAPYLRKEFAVEGKVRRARLYASGLGYAELHLNGKKVGGTAERDPGYTNFDKRVLYVTHDVTSSVKKGTNSLGAILGTGWYDVHDRATWNFDRAPWRGRPRMRLVLVIDYADGKTESIASDPTWKASTGPILTDGIYTGELYDARKELPGWDTPGYEDSAWKTAVVMPDPKGMLSARACPPIVISKSIKPISITEPKPGVFVVDFGQNFSGHARLKVKGEAGTKITMRYSEKLDAKGMIERGEIEKFMTKDTPPQPFQTDTYICKGTGTEEWEQRFSYEGFRYMEVTGFPGKPNLDNFRGQFAHTDLKSGGEFSCSNDLLNKIQKATLYAYLSNAQSIPTDCPQREKNGWTGDAHLACEAGLMNFDSPTFYTKWLDDYADDQKKDGRFSLIIPSGGWGQGAAHPAWDSAFGIIANDLHLYHNDTRLLTKHYDHLKSYVDFLSTQAKEDVIPFDSLGDWLPWKTETSSQLTSTVMYFLDAQIVSKAAMLKGNVEDSVKYGELAERIKKAFNKKFFDPSGFNTATQAALSMGIYFKLVPEEHKKAALAALVKNVETQGHIDTGILGAKFILRVLSENGRTDLAYKLVARKELPGWGYWIEQGATTLWEDWKGESSLNHIMFGDVSNWFYQWIAGIGLDPEVPAFRHILIRPQVVGDLTWAKAHVNSAYGKIASSWRKSGKGFRLEIEIPANTTATVWVPGTAKAAKGLSLSRTENGCSVFEVGSGKYAFDSK